MVQQSNLKIDAQLLCQFTVLFIIYICNGFCYSFLQNNIKSKVIISYHIHSIAMNVHHYKQCMILQVATV